MWLSSFQERIIPPNRFLHNISKFIISFQFLHRGLLFSTFSSCHCPHSQRNSSSKSVSSYNIKVYHLNPIHPYRFIVFYFSVMSLSLFYERIIPQIGFFKSYQSLSTQSNSSIVVCCFLLSFHVIVLIPETNNYSNRFLY